MTGSDARRRAVSPASLSSKDGAAVGAVAVITAATSACRTRPAATAWASNHAYTGASGPQWQQTPVRGVSARLVGRLLGECFQFNPALVARSQAMQIWSANGKARGES